MSQTKQQGSPWYLISIVLVAVLGGLLFGYDTCPSHSRLRGRRRS